MEKKYDEQFRIVFEAITQLIEEDEKPKKKIGYLKASAAISIANKMDEGESLTGRVGSYYVPPGKDHPRASLVLKY